VTLTIQPDNLWSACLLYASILAGLALAFGGALRNEEPRALAVAGFALNGAWFIVLPGLIAVSALTPSEVPAATRQHHDPMSDMAVKLQYADYMLADHPGRKQTAFLSLIHECGRLTRKGELREAHIRLLFGKPDHVAQCSEVRTLGFSNGIAPYPKHVVTFDMVGDVVHRVSLTCRPQENKDGIRLLDTATVASMTTTEVVATISRCDETAPE
jgi:hypothetical protein